MAAPIYKRRKFDIVVATLSLVLLLSSLTPCFALCTAAREAAKPVAKAPVPSCHEAPAADVVANPGAPTCSEKPSASHCCCLSERSTTVPSDPPMVAAARDAAASAPVHFEYIASAVHTAHHAHLRHSCPDRSPPGTPIFIAHHALLI